MIYLRRQSLELASRMRCGGICWDSSLARVFSTTTRASRSIRRRRPTTSRLGTKTSDDAEVAAKFASQVNKMVESVSGFVATDKDGRETTMDEYLKFATLSPWVPCPDPVARRCLDIAKAGPNDVSHISMVILHRIVHCVTITHRKTKRVPHSRFTTSWVRVMVG